MTEGQELAIQQLRDVAAASKGAIELLDVRPLEKGSSVVADITYYCKDMPRAAEGLPLRDRERLKLRIPAGFPFELPSVRASHSRFAGFSHVQWGKVLCLYQASDTEWNPSDGMFGFLDRLDEWLKHGALNELDPEGAPLHPPVAYTTASGMIVPRADTPRVSGQNWFGSAHLQTHSDSRVDLVGWSPLLAEETPSNIAAAILLAEPYTYFEFPTNVETLVNLLAAHGVAREHLLLTLQAAVIHNEKDNPLYVIIGTPMRGIQGGERSQHLTAWYVEPTLANALRMAVSKYSKNIERQELGSEAEKLIWEWAEVASAKWCRVEEDRPEVTQRRDHNAAVAWFRNKTIALWGCGALGGYLAEYLVRAGVRKLILRDNGVVTPGILSRQVFDDADIGRSKVRALSDRLLRIQPDGSMLEIEAHVDNVLYSPLNEDDWTDNADIVLNATASGRVEKKLEQKWRGDTSPRVPVASMVVGHRAEHGFVVLARAEHSGGPADVNRRTKLAALKNGALALYLDEFWPSTSQRQERLFQPEPGCSDATFVGSAADLAALAGMMLNQIGIDVASSNESTAFSHFISQAYVRSREEGPEAADFSWCPDNITTDPFNGYEVRLSPSSLSAISKWIMRSRWLRGASVETGGLLFGERDDAAKVVWVSEASGPPIDSEASSTGFVCGTAGTAEKSSRKEDESRGSVRYIGMWHTHPGGLPEPSDIDYQGMSYLLSDQSRALLLIVGGTVDRPSRSAFLFTKYDLQQAGTLDATPRVGSFAQMRRGIYSIVTPIRRGFTVGYYDWYHRMARFWRRFQS